MEITVPNFLEIKESSIHGLGVFAKEDIPKDTLLGKYTGIKYTREEFVAKYGDDFKYCYSTRFPWVPIICAKECRHFMTYINESKEPNVYFKRYKLYALQDIQAGIELTLKYPKQYPRN